GGPIRARLMPRRYALVGALTGPLGALAALGVGLEAAPVAIEAAALSTRAAAERLGIAPYTLNDLARTGRIPSRQDTPGGPRHFRPADLEAYEQSNIAAGVSQRYTPPHHDLPRSH